MSTSIPGPQTGNVLASAYADYQEGKYETAEAAFRARKHDPVVGNTARYFTGLCLLRMGKNSQAEEEFRKLILVAPAHADALYQLGGLAGARNDMQQAKMYFEDALRFNPEHQDAAIKLGWVQRTLNVSPSDPPSDNRQPSRPEQPRHFPPPAILTPPSPASSTASSTLPPEFEARLPDLPSQQGGVASMSAQDISYGDPNRSPIGAYEILRNMDDLTSQLILAMLEKYNWERRPRLSAFIDRMLVQVVIGFLAAYIVLQLTQSISYWFGTATDPTLTFNSTVLAIYFLIVVAVVLVVVVNVKTTVYRVFRGRVQVTKGIALRRWRSVELYRVTDVQTERSWMQLLTNDASLVLIQAQDRISLPGFGPAGETRNVAQELLNLIFLLRTTNLTRGIIS